MRKKNLWIFLSVSLILSILGLNGIEIAAQEDIHDIAVVSVTPSLKSVKVGELVNITAVVENNGDFTETFNVTMYQDTSVIETEKTVQNLTAGTSTTLTFTWDTTGTKDEVYALNKKEKTYNLTATASTVAGETNTEDNTLVLANAVKVISYYIAVVPRRIVDTSLTSGETFTVSIYTDYNGTDVWGWEFSLTYNPNVLEGVSLTNGDLITEEKSEDAEFMRGTFDNNLGKLSITGAYFFFYAPAAPVTTSGPGTLANITFNVVGIGDSNITLVTKETVLTAYDTGTGEFPDVIDKSTPNYDHIMYGYFRNTLAPVTHDIAIVSVTPSDTSVTAGELLNVTVVVENEGIVPEDVTVTVYRDFEPGLTYWDIGEKSIPDLENGTSTTLIFTWNTTGVPAGDHTVTAKVDPVAGETDVADNTLESPKIVTIKRREEEPLPVTLIIGAAVGVVAAVAVVLFALRRGKKPLPE